MILIGYSGHAFVVAGILLASGKKITGYCDFMPKGYNPFQLAWFGDESSAEGIEKIKANDFFIAVGNNGIRKKIYHQLAGIQRYPVNAIHPAAIIDQSSKIGEAGTMISSGVCINPLAEISVGAICNTGCIIEHECRVGAFAHIGPGAILCGNVTVGDESFIGAGAVIRQGITIGRNVVIGAGAVVIKNVGDNQMMIGNPSRILIK